jgi:hypothetical protein
VTLVGVLVTIALLVAVSAVAVADPCGMVPPVYVGEGPPIVRVGAQKTYVFYKDGVETFAIRPGYSGNVDEFGMLIPFPTPPALRKLPDHVFQHITAAIDPPEVVVDLRQLWVEEEAAEAAPADDADEGALRYDEVRVLRQEAVGMYEVAVLEAGSAQALKRWMDMHGYTYPEGMDAACEDYVAEGWCFVAVKTKVGRKKGVQPQPGQRETDSKLPTGATFDGRVQAMGFRFKVDELVVPMRLSAFNVGDFRNIVYLLTDGPKKIRSIPQEYVVRQLPGEQVHRNVTGPLPLRIIGGDESDIPDWWRQSLPQQRDPTPHNGAAKDLFAADLLAVSSGKLSLAHEEEEKVLLRIGERLGLRGAEIDALNAQVLAEQREETVQAAIEDLKGMTLTVIDGDFPPEVLGRENLTFTSYTMPPGRNTPVLYDAVKMKPRPVTDMGATEGESADSVVTTAPLERHEEASPETPSTNQRGIASSTALLIAGTALAALVIVGLVMLMGKGKKQ